MLAHSQHAQPGRPSRRLYRRSPFYWPQQRPIRHAGRTGTRRNITADRYISTPADMLYLDSDEADYFI